MAQQETKQNNVPTLLQLEVPEPVEFNKTIQTNTLLSKDLEKNISELLMAFDDYEGCKIVEEGGRLVCNSYFKPCMNKAEDGSYAVKVRGENVQRPAGKGFSPYDLVANVNMLSRSKDYELEDSAKELLAEFLLLSNADAILVDRYNDDLGKVVKVRLPKNWNMYTAEIVDQMQNTNFRTPYLVVKLDLQLLVAKLYGRKDPAEVVEFKKRNAIPKDRYEYYCSIVRKVNAQSLLYILEIKKVDKIEIENLMKQMGIGMVSGNIPMTRR